MASFRLGGVVHTVPVSLLVPVKLDGYISLWTKFKISVQLTVWECKPLERLQSMRRSWAYYVRAGLLVLTGWTYFVSGLCCVVHIEQDSTICVSRSSRPNCTNFYICVQHTESFKRAEKDIQ